MMAAGTTPATARSGASGIHESDGVRPSTAKTTVKAPRIAPPRKPAFSSVRLGVEAALTGRTGHSRHRLHVSRHTHVELPLFLRLENFNERARQDRFELLVHLVLGPEARLQVLHPLEVGDGDAARVGEDVGH